MTCMNVSSVASVFLIYSFFFHLYFNAAGHNYTHISRYITLELKPILITQNIIRKNLKMTPGDCV